MRHDAIGMFWQDLPAKPGSNKLARVQPPIPDTGWTPPREFPNLSSTKTLTIDTETYDPHLEELGPGWARGDGHIVGVSLAADDGPGWYFPIRHTVEADWNLDPQMVLSWLRDTISSPKPKIGANLYYDVGWLAHEGIQVGGDLYDVQLAEALLSETDLVNLDALGERYLGRGKQTNLLYQWCSDFYGGDANGKQRKNLWRAPPRLVGPYAVEDVHLPRDIIKLQWRRLMAEGLTEVFRMECDLIYLVVAMRYAGVRVSLERANHLREELMRREALAQTNLDTLACSHVEVTKPDSIARAFDRLGLPYPHTAKTGKPSFTKVFLKNTHNPVADAVNDIRGLQKLRGTFIESYILGAHVNENVHCEFKLLRGDDDGTRSGRFSSANPNLQNIPIRHELAKDLRGMFVPFPGHRGWRKFDYSQIEYRLLVHFAVGLGADEARRQFNEDPDTDYHEYVINLIKELTAVVLERRPAKNMNFGLIYGMGQDKLIRELGVDDAAGKKLFEAYHRAIPYAHETMRYFNDEATRTGIIRTIMGRCSRFDLWESSDWGQARIGLPYEAALLKFGEIRRAFTHKGLNRKLQGSAADIMKKAMWLAWKQGVFSYTGVPTLTVHDELDFSDPGNCDDAFAHLKHVMENAIPLSIPIKVDEERGPDWGHTEKAGLKAA